MKNHFKYFRLPIRGLIISFLIMSILNGCKPVKITYNKFESFDLNDIQEVIIYSHKPNALTTIPFSRELFLKNYLYKITIRNEAPIDEIVKKFKALDLVLKNTNAKENLRLLCQMKFRKKIFEFGVNLDRSIIIDDQSYSVDHQFINDLYNFIPLK